MGFKSFVIYRQLLFHSDAFCKSKGHGKDPTKYSWPLTLLPNYKVSNLECIFHNWRRFYLTSALCKCQRPKIKFTKKRSSWHWGRLLQPRMSDQEHFFPFIFPSLIILFLILIPGRLLWFFCSPSSLSWPEKIMPLLTYLRSLGNPASNQLLDLLWCSWFCSSLCSSQTSPWFPVPQLLWNKLAG